MIARRRRWFAAAFVVIGLVTGVATTLTSDDAPSLLAAALLIGCTVIASRFEVVIGKLALLPSFLPLVLAATLEPRLAPIVALGCVAEQAPNRLVRAINVGMYVTAASAASLAAQAAGSVAWSIAIATAAFLVVNATMIGGYLRAVRLTTLREFAVVATASVFATAALTIPLVALVTWAFHSIGTAALPLTIVPMTLIIYFNGLYHRKLQLTEQLAEKAQVLAKTNLQFAAAMVRALDTRDAYTAGHSAAVAVYTRDIAREMGFDDETVRLAHLSGLLHDIGKIGVPGRVLNKTAPLDDEEYELMKTHAAMGAEILGEVDLYHEIAVLVRYHHERIDGRGYPDGISGEAIPAISRMISVADTYSAMTTDRPYREGMPTEKAMSILRECRGTQLDADFTDAFLRILIVADEAYQRGKQTDFEVEVAKHQALSEVEAEAVRVNAPTPAGPKAPAAPEVPMLPAAVDGELVEVDLEREAA